MKVLILNGSPRLNGNTKTALKAAAEGIVENCEHDVEFIDVTKYDVKGCMACNYCKTSDGICVIKDDGNLLVEKIYEADVVIFGSPVYWWGITAQIKAVIDRIYCKNQTLNKLKKKIGIISVGAAELSDREYELISGQFQCICEYLNWDLIIDEKISAEEVGDLAKDSKKILELKELWRKI
ncbi:flavodoxin family protein [Fusobacterium sp.]|uniref:flavodoxin family protein n=1 Tax=Fusobacterium sp. TaxID=68766 RepID=UPI00261A166A|nr:flavodoxin family protein [Fusobacterium sp.]